MRVRVLYFAIVRERIRREEEEWEVSSGETIGALLERIAARYPSIAPLRTHLQIARNRVSARHDEVLVDGDEVALIPPVSGGSGEQRVAIRDRPLELDEVVRWVTDGSDGAIVTFTGVVRRESRGQRIERLEYEAYRAMAEERMRAIAQTIERRFGARIAILHRVGTLVVGEAAVVIAAAAPHRVEAFDACREAIERLKAEVPIWKKEIGEDGEEWIGFGP